METSPSEALLSVLLQGQGIIRTVLYNRKYNYLLQKVAIYIAGSRSRVYTAHDLISDHPYGAHMLVSQKFILPQKKKI